MFTESIKLTIQTKEKELADFEKLRERLTNEIAIKATDLHIVNLNRDIFFLEKSLVSKV